jgi:hypothetical protein
MNTERISVDHGKDAAEQLTRAHALIEECTPGNKGHAGVLLVTSAEDLTVCSLNANHMQLLIMLTTAKSMIEEVLKGEIQRSQMGKNDLN